MNSRSRAYIITSLIVLSILVTIMFASAGIGKPHGINGYVDNCGSPFDVDGASVTFQLADSSQNPYAGVDVLTDTVGLSGNSAKSGWYAADAGNFDKSWNVGDTILVTVSKSGQTNSTYVKLTNAGSDQVFTICLGHPGEFECACGNGVCERYPPLCEDAWSEALNNIRCPEDCLIKKGKCGDHLCQTDRSENSITCCEDCMTCDHDKKCEFGESFLCCSDCPYPCGDALCQPEYNENANSCPTDCGPAVCGDDECNPEFENWENCPTDCMSLYSTCGDGACEGQENQDNCCEDCGCPSPQGCAHFECINHSCQKTCCLFGYCCVWLGLCWFWWVLIIIIIVAAIIIYLLTRKNLEKIIRALSRIRKAKEVHLASKIEKINQLAKYK